MNGPDGDKELVKIRRPLSRHWVGDGFPVQTLFNYNGDSEELSPFLLLDYVGPFQFPPTEKRLGVGPHPHRGFETVTLVYSGEVEHRDSSGGGGIIGPGDVQWMTAGAGVVHEEFHGKRLASQGGWFEAVQLWVNLPARDKMAPPRYQTLLKSSIPVAPLPQGQGNLRVIAGTYRDMAGPAQLHSPLNIWDMNLSRAQNLEFELPPGYSSVLAVLKGSVAVNGAARTVNACETGVFAHAGSRVTLTAEAPVKALLLSGEPIEEPVVGSGPFVMNTLEEIYQAMDDFQSGKMGRIS